MARTGVREGHPERPGAAATEEGLAAHVRGYAERGMLSRDGVPDRVVFVVAIERTSVGKINERVLRERCR